MKSHPRRQTMLPGRLERVCHMKSSFNRPLLAAMICILQLGLCVAAGSSQAQTRQPKPDEIAGIRDCANKNADNLDEGERQCLFNLVAQPCTSKGPGDADNATVVDCYRIENSIWDGLLNENYKSLLEALDAGQRLKARAMQLAWLAYRDTTCGFYDDKIQGSMAVSMAAACVTRETARRAMLLRFFSQL
jgi:uncharacterized protein YecT (DUF1311 family)